jgi:hypothetical protein
MVLIDGLDSRKRHSPRMVFRNEFVRPRSPKLMRVFYSRHRVEGGFVASSGAGGTKMLGMLLLIIRFEYRYRPVPISKISNGLDAINARYRRAFHVAAAMLDKLRYGDARRPRLKNPKVHVMTPPPPPPAPPRAAPFQHHPTIARQ